MKVLGIDGWKGKWVAITLEDGQFSDLNIHCSLEETSRLSADYCILGIDIPIGLSETPPRPADVLAREYIGPRRSSVFDPPPKFCLNEDLNHAEANQESQKRFDRGISAQSYALMNLIREADRVSKNDQRFYEIHPEVTFTYLKGDHLAFSKKTWNGMHERIKLLSNAGIKLPKTLKGDLGKIPPDDLLDAAAVAWSANRIAKGEAASFPDTGNRKREKIWY